jgi:mRNA interferase MazF
MNEGQIILAELPQILGTPKRRPVLVLRQMPGYGDYLVCGLSSQTHQYLPGFDELLTPDSTNNLRVVSVVRLSFLDVVPATQLFGQLGSISASMLASLKQRLADHLTAV